MTKYCTSEGRMCAQARKLDNAATTKKNEAGFRQMRIVLLDMIAARSSQVRLGLCRSFEGEVCKYSEENGHANQDEEVGPHREDVLATQREKKSRAHQTSHEYIRMIGTRYPPSRRLLPKCHQRTKLYCANISDPSAPAPGQPEK